MDFAGPVARDHEPVQLRIRKSISRFNHLPIDLIPDSKIQRELRRWPPIILSVEVCPQRSSIGLASSDTDLGAGGITQKKIRNALPSARPGVEDVYRGVKFKVPRALGELSGLNRRR